MGAYLSQPITEKVSSDGQSEHLSYGDSSMQGWRVSQEDAHNSLPDLAPGCSLFAVYDGHGGHEVAAYAAQHLPDAIRQCPLYSAGRVRESLRKAFLEFDKSLTQAEVIEKLKAIAGREAESEDEEETDREVDELFQEAHMPLDELMARYQGDKAAAAAGVARLRGKGKEKPLSPFLRAKAGGSGAGSSSSGSSNSNSDGEVKKDLAEELAEEKSEPSESANSESSENTATSETTPETKTESKSESKTDAVKSSTDAEVKSGLKSDSIIKSETNSKSPVKADSNSNATVKSEPIPKSNSNSPKKTNGTSGSGEPAPSPIPDSTPSPNTDSTGGGDAPAINGNGTASPEKTPSPTSKSGKGGKGARPGSGKSPAPAGQRQKATGARPTRKLPERAAAEVYRDVLEGARKAREAGHEHVEDEEGEEEEEDDDFSLEQSDSVDDDDNDVEEDDSDEEEDEDEEEEEEDEEEDSDQEDDELGDEEAGDDEDSEFMFNMKDEPGSDSGCTAVVALLHGRQLYVANIGDSRCVLSRSGRAVDMSDDHKPEDEPELQRIVKAGGKVTVDGRVNGGLNLSRAFGDHAYKTDKTLPAEEQMISACPDIRCVTIEPDTDEFMVLACDGIWNSKKSQEVVDFVSERIRERGETQLSKICEELFDECLAPNTMGDGTGCDNMTCIIVRFLPSLARVAGPVAEDPSADELAPAAAPEKAPEQAAEETPEATEKTEGEEAGKGSAEVEKSDGGAAPRPEPEGAPPEKRRRTE